MLQTSKKLSAAVALVMLAINAAAVQKIEGADKKLVEVNVSANEPNRLVIGSGREVVNIIPSQKGAITTKVDDTNSAVYFYMADAFNKNATVTLFVDDDKNTNYKLLLKPKSIPAEEIIIIPPNSKSSGEVNQQSGSYQRRIKNLILTMADQRLSSKMDAVIINEVIPLWQEGQLTLIEKYIQEEAVGERYVLTNISNAAMLVAEQELYRPGVIAVAIRNHTLPPKGKTEIFIVRERKENE